MGRSLYVEKYVEVEVELEDFDTEELIEELERRGTGQLLVLQNGLIDKIYHARRQGKPYDHLLDQFLYEQTGRVI